MKLSDEKLLTYIDDFDYKLPDERIAKYPLQKRDTSKLLIWKAGAISESHFSDISEFLPENALLIYNNTRVIQARIVFHKSTGARIEIFCLEPLQPSDYALSLSSTHSCDWKCMVGNLKKWKQGALTRLVKMDGNEIEFSAELMEIQGNTHRIKFSWDDDSLTFSEILMRIGELPIPPYLHRKTEESDKRTYQTVYSKIEGSVAAPTAGLHFTPEVFERLKRKAIQTEELTLHVGAGTFQPVKSATIEQHNMHTEIFAVRLTTIQNILKNLGNIVAVGTTSVRTLESLYYIGKKIQSAGSQKVSNFKIDQWVSYEISEEDISTDRALQNIIDYLKVNKSDVLHGETQILIKPGFRFRVVDAMITNFHQPRSTLLLLVSAFVNGQWRQIYDYALSHDFRFLSYGDSSLLLK